MGKRKSTSQSTQNSTTVMTPTNPDWVTAAAQGLGATLQKQGSVDPYSLIAPLSGLESQAATTAARLGQGFGGGAKPAGGDAWFADLLSNSAPNVAAASLLDNLNAYTNPYRQQVLDAATADFDASAEQARAAQKRGLAGSSGFGGSGAALAQAFTEGELSRARNSQLANLLSGMFNTSAGLAAQDADRRQQAATANAQMAMENARMQGDLALQRDASMRDNVAAQAALGAQLRGVDQAQRNAPQTQLANQIDMFSGLPLQLFQGQTTNATGKSSGTSTQSPSTLDMIGQVAKIGADIARMFPAPV